MDRRSFVKRLGISTICATHAGLLAGEPKTSATRVRIDSDGMFVANGQRQFILGLYMLPNVPDPWREAQEAGFNLVHLSADPAEFARAHSHGMYGWTSLGSIPLQNSAEAEARIRKTVMALKDEPALLFWETEDEPSFIWKKREPRILPKAIIETSLFIKRLDSAHPLYLNHSPTNLVPTLQAYNEGADIVATDIYPVVPEGIRELYALWPNGKQGDLLNSHISQVGQYAVKAREIAGPKRAVFMVLQGFAWENLREKDRDPAMVLYPTRQQSRFIAWQSVVNGANGLLYWGLSYTPAQTSFWNDLKSVAQELHELKEALAARRASLKPRLIYHDTGHSLDRGIEWATRPWKGSTVLVAVNADPNPVEVTFAGLSKFRRCEVLFESRSVDPRGGDLRDSFAPFDTHLYRLSA